MYNHPVWRLEEVNSDYNHDSWKSERREGDEWLEHQPTSDQQEQSEHCYRSCARNLDFIFAEISGNERVEVTGAYREGVFEEG